MPFGEIVSVLRADLVPLEQDLKKAEQRVRDYLNRVNALHARLSAQGAAASSRASRSPFVDPLLQFDQSMDKAERARRRKMVADEAAERARRQIMEAAERDYRRLNASHAQAERDAFRQQELRDQQFRRLAAGRTAAEREEGRRRVAAAKQAAEEEQRVQEKALAFYRRQSGLGPVGGARSPGTGLPVRSAGGPGSFIMPEHLRGLDEANAKWLKQQQAIAAAGTLTERLHRQFEEMGKKDLEQLVEGTKQWTNWLGVGAVGAASGLAVAFGKYALDTNIFFERSKITIAEILSLTTKLTDTQGHALSLAQQQNINYKEASKLIEMVRQASIRTSLPAQTLVNIYSRGLGFATAAGATPEKAVPLIAQISNLGRALGARDERELAQEVRATLTGQNITRSRVGQALGLTRADIMHAREMGKEVDFLTERLKAGEPYLKRWAASWEGITTTAQTKWQDFVEAATGRLYERLKGRLIDVNKLFSPENIERWGRAFSDYLIKAWDKADAFFKSDGFKRFADTMKYLAEHSKQIVEAILAFKSMEALVRAAAVITQMYKLSQNLLQLKGDGGPAIGTTGSATAEGVGAGVIAGGALSAVGTGLGLYGAAKAGFSIGDYINQQFIGNNEDQADQTNLDTSLFLIRHRDTASRMAARHLVQRRQAELAEAQQRIANAAVERSAPLVVTPENMAHFTQPSERKELAARQAALQQALTAQKQVEQQITAEQVKESLKRAAATDKEQQYRRQSMINASNERKSDLLKMEAFVHRVLKGETDDKKEQLKEQEKAEEATILKTLGATKQAYDLIHKLRAHLTEQLSKEAEKERIDAMENRIATAQFAAEATGDELAQVRLRSAKEYEDRVKAINDDQTIVDKQKAIRQAYNLERIKNEREVQEKVHELQTHTSELQKQTFDQQANFHRARMTAEKEFQDLQQRTSKELRDTLREQVDLQRQATRAEEDRINRVQSAMQSTEQRNVEAQLRNLFRGAVVPGGQGAPVTPGQEKQLASVQRLLNSDNPFERQEGERQAVKLPFFGMGRTATTTPEQEQQIRDLANQIASGNPETARQAFGEAQKLGFLTPQNAGLVGNLANQSVNLQNQRADQSDTEAARRDQREMEDAVRSAQDIRRQQGELQQRQAEILKSYADASTKLRDDWTKTVVDAADNLKKLNVEIKDLVRSLVASHQRVPASISQAMQAARPVAPAHTLAYAGAAAGTAGNVAAIQSEGHVTNNYMINDLNLTNLSAGDQKFIQDFAQMLIDLSRRTRPTTR